MHQETIKKIGLVLAIVIFSLIFVFVWQSLGQLEDTSRTSALEMVRAAVGQAIMQCYALEGAYPPDLSYLKTQYGLILDETRYAFYYEVIGDNVYPIIDVQRLEDVRQ